MQIEFEDHDLRRLYEELDFRLPQFGTDLIKSYRKTVAFVIAAADQRDLYKMRSLRLEKLIGDRVGQHSLRLNDKWRMIIKIEMRDVGQVIVILDLVDYH